jgi:hypothetical protein
MDLERQVEIFLGRLPIPLIKFFSMKACSLHHLHPLQRLPCCSKLATALRRQLAVLLVA